jgi:Dolichyl-phosphate-mannose-protein mannosyltransferase
VTVAEHGSKAAAATRPVRAYAVLAAATIACLLPSMNKAFCIDDPLFLWAAAHIQAHPLDFYGFDVNWYSMTQPFYDVMKNPPLASYYIAGTAALFGWREPVLHAAFLLPAVGAICGTWFVARMLCPKPVLAAVLALATPAFLVSSSNVMCDTTMLCLWTWAIGLWLFGIEQNRNGSLALAAFAIGAAEMTKYFAISLIPLLGVYTILRRRKPTFQLCWLMIPVVVLAAYQYWTWRQYGRGLLGDAANFAWRIEAAAGPGQAFADETVSSKILVSLAFAGGSYLTLLFCAPWLWSKRSLTAFGALGLATTVCARWYFNASYLEALHMAVPFGTGAAMQFGLMATVGLLLVCLTLADLAKRQSADAFLLTLWVFGTFAFAGFVNWTCNVRSLLPVAPALGILVVRRFEILPASVPRIDWRWALIPAVAVSIVVSWADRCLADSARTAAARIAADLKSEPGPLWFQGHWGFQYYMHAQGGRSVDVVNPETLPGDIMIVPANNTDVVYNDHRFFDCLQEFEFAVYPWLTTLQPRVGAGSYSSIWGPMPFVLGPAPPEKYAIWRLKFHPSSKITLPNQKQ